MKKIGLLWAISLLVSCYASAENSPSFPIEEKKIELACKLYEVGVIKFGEFPLQNNVSSPVSVDLRLIPSYPDLMMSIVELLHAITADCSYVHVCGASIAGIPLASFTSAKYNTPLLLANLEELAKGRSLVQGKFTEKDACLVIDDIATSGKGMLNMIEKLERTGITIKDVAVILNRQQEARRKLQNSGYTLHAIFTMSELIEILAKEGKLNPKMHETVKEYLIASSSDI